MIALCLALGLVQARLPLTEFTLAWTHSVEKVRWEEDYRVTAAGLELTAARVQGSGAGMEPPAGAELRTGWWHYRPALPPLPALRLTLSSYSAGYQLCAAGGCRALADLLGGEGVVELTPCARE
ncbi:MAG TPA: DUF1850 domain-containing protein [Candidatus Competibacteraceae bacterium]|nr:DUF1850 domain-containing protein [Candidatus Competibacteraceae bacterium]